MPTWIKSLFARKGHTADRKRVRTRLAMENLEGREMPAGMTFALQVPPAATASFDNSDRVLRVIGTGWDYLYGGANDDWMDAGGYHDGALSGGEGNDFNAYTPVVNGASYTDIKQGGGPTCWVMSTLAAAAYRNVDLAGKLTYLGDGVYRVTWAKPDGLGRTYEDVTFTGDMLPTDAVPHHNNQEGESWTLIYQRAMLQQAGRQWDNPGSGGTAGELALLTGRNTTGIARTDLAGLRSALGAGRLVTALTWDPPVAGTASMVASGLVADHWYVVKQVRDVMTLDFSLGYARMVASQVVDLYNPHGSSVTVSWADFSRSMEAVNSN